MRERERERETVSFSGVHGGKLSVFRLMLCPMISEAPRASFVNSEAMLNISRESLYAHCWDQSFDDSNETRIQNYHSIQ